MDNVYNEFQFGHNFFHETAGLQITDSDFKSILTKINILTFRLEATDYQSRLVVKS